MGGLLRVQRNLHSIGQATHRERQGAWDFCAKRDSDHRCGLAAKELPSRRIDGQVADFAECSKGVPKTAHMKHHVRGEEQADALLCLEGQDAI